MVKIYERIDKQGDVALDVGSIESVSIEKSQTLISMKSGNEWFVTEHAATVVKFLEEQCTQ